MTDICPLQTCYLHACFKRWYKNVTRWEIHVKETWRAIRNYWVTTSKCCLFMPCVYLAAEHFSNHFKPLKTYLKIIKHLVPSSSKNYIHCCQQKRVHWKIRSSPKATWVLLYTNRLMYNFSYPFSAMYHHVHLILFIIITCLLQSHCHSAAVVLSLAVRCLGLLLLLQEREALLHPQGACKMAEGAAHVSVTLCGPAGNGIAAAPPEACSGWRLAAVRSALPPFWHCCHHWLAAMESCQLGWQPLVGLNLVSSLRALKNRKGENQKFFHLNLC